MNELWIITAVVFAAVVLGVEASYWLMSHSWRAKKSITRTPARGQLTILRPQPRPTRENSVPIQDPAMILKIRRAMSILKQDTVSQEDLSRLEREGKLQ